MTNGIIGCVFILRDITLSILLTLGLPYGEYAMGGRYKVLPQKLR